MNDLNKNFSFLDLDVGRKKICPEYKIASKLDICKITDTNSNQRLIKGIQVCISVNFVFTCSIL